ncbi:MATE family efflux transporter [Pseudothermotoga thermarum]|uniref:Multidrug-efflux transporter n=1 Tax=Pseudothermotoga thermarum DSM 5069 TaxID=688269 RepID=F7YU52_9THEM|nr:MATE family efflux transporter [Pseudothermotoga thermarum]AEH50148.1 MATE efflux family protein [Pseudothermotoga thermarum DSM 5069]
MRYSLIKPYLSKIEAKRVGKELLSLGLPAMAENALHMLLGIVDTAFLGHLSWQAMTGAGLANQLFFVLQVFIVAVSTGVTVLVANSVGAKNYRMVGNVVWNSLYLAFGWGVLLMCLAPFSKYLLSIFPKSDQIVYQSAVDYLQVILYGILGMFLMAVLSASLKGAGDTKTPMFVVAMSNLLNVFLDYAMIFGKFGFPALGVKGAALATIISRFFGSILLFIAIMKSERLNVKPKYVRLFNLKIIKNILSVGLPTSFESLSFSAGLIIFTNILFIAGPMAYAGHRIGINIESLSFMPGLGISVAVTTLVGMYNGKGDLTKVAGVVRQGWIIITIFQVSVGVFILLFPEPLILLFTKEPEIVQLAKLPVRLIGMFQFFLALDFLANGALRGTANTSVPFIFTTIAMWLVRLPLAFVLVSHFNLGLLGGWIGMISDIVFRSTTKILYYLSGKWEKKAEKVRTSVKSNSLIEEKT